MSQFCFLACGSTLTHVTHAICKVKHKNVSFTSEKKCIVSALKRTKNCFAARLHTDPMGELTAFPWLLAGLRGRDRMGKEDKEEQIAPKVTSKSRRLRTVAKKLTISRQRENSHRKCCSC